MYTKKIFLAFTVLLLVNVTMAQKKVNSTKMNNYWNNNTALVSYRLPPPPVGYKPTYVDLDGDGDPDLLYSVTIRNTPILWIDDDDDMKVGDTEGDTDSDCLLIDVNKDGKYCFEADVAIDWIDTDADGKADMQVFVENAQEGTPKMWGDGQHYMWVLDTDKDDVFNYIDWNTFGLRAWVHEGASDFLEDYSGQSTFLKVHSATNFLKDVRFSWENPFLFLDPDKDGLTEMAIRVLDSPKSSEKSLNPVAGGINFTQMASYVAMSIDMDNDNAAGNDFDYDLSINFTGKGFYYGDQSHKFNNKRVIEADTFFMDARWRQISELIYADQDSVFNLTFNKGDWQKVSFVYDEDDDCERWERVEFYDALKMFETGPRNGGLDNNPQADAIGDRGEWDADNSGKGKLYLSKFDGRLHLFGAEWGCWRVDQLAKSYQGWGGLYDTEPRNMNRLQKLFTPYSTFRYEDSDNNGFIDKIAMDLDGDTIFEKTVSLKDLKIDDRCGIINTSTMKYDDYRKLHTEMSNNIWNNAEKALLMAEKAGLNTSWYAKMKSPKSENQKYNYGYWLQFYIYMDLIDQAKRQNNSASERKIDQAYFGENWDLLLK